MGNSSRAKVVVCHCEGASATAAIVENSLSVGELETIAAVAEAPSQ